MRTLVVLLLSASACTRASSAPKPADQRPAAVAPVARAITKVGAPIAADVPVVALADVAKDPDAYRGKTFVTSGVVTAVCQEMGCWMEIRDAADQVHVTMAGEKFFVPKASAGRKARVEGTIVDVDGGDADCTKAASAQTGGKAAKVQLEATGVELD